MTVFAFFTYFTYHSECSTSAAAVSDSVESVYSSSPCVGRGPLATYPPLHSTPQAKRHTQCGADAGPTLPLRTRPLAAPKGRRAER